MKLTVFPANQGDCLLLRGADGRNLLVDGGMPRSYTTYVAPALHALRALGEQLDLVCVSHIDEDHIGGVLRMLDDLVAWKVFDYHVNEGNLHAKAPAAPRPPDIVGIWHNGFSEQVKENVGEIEQTVEAVATILSGADDLDLREVALDQRGLITGTRQAIELARRIGPKQLGIPLNQEFGGGLILRGNGAAPIQLGGMTIAVVGPSDEELKRLRKEWNEWLTDNQDVLDQLGQQSLLTQHLLATADELRRLMGVLQAQTRAFGQRNRVTVPNLASIMLLVEEDQTTVLLTGDGHAKDILTGLDQLGRLDGEGRIHVNVLKAPHHGSHHNIDPDFCKQVIADHYVFCGNGAHHNPELDVIDLIIDSRLGTAAQRSAHPKAGRPFKLWFNSSASLEHGSSREAHMRAVEKLVKRRADRSNGRMTYAFVTADGLVDSRRHEIELPA